MAGNAAPLATGATELGISEGERERRKVQDALLELVGSVASAIGSAKRVDDVICPLHSIAVRLFAVNSTLLSGVLDERYKSKVLDIPVPEDFVREYWKRSFYQGAAFPTLSRILIYHVTPDWLACFPLTARKLVFDSFFVNGPPLEIIQALVPCLVSKESNETSDLNAARSNAERLLGLCLLADGVYNMALGFGNGEEYVHKIHRLKDYTVVSTAAQLLSSIPDKVTLKPSAALSAHFFFKQVTIQLLAAAEERAIKLFSKGNSTTDDGTFIFVADAFTRICRRGSADILLAESVPRILDLVRSYKLNTESNIRTQLESNPKYLFWSNLMEYLQDPFVLERLSEQFLRVLASEDDVKDVEAYWTLWVLYHKTYEQPGVIRSFFGDKFLLWKVFPISCLKWILDFSVFDCPPSSSPENGMLQNAGRLMETLQRLLNVWSKREFVQNSPMDQQAYITAAIGLCLERISKEKLEATHNALSLILQGISCRLESPIELVRRTASSVALVFSKVIDPNNLLYLDDSCKGGIDWEMGLISSNKKVRTSPYKEKKASSNGEHGKMIAILDEKASPKVKHMESDKGFELSKLQVIDPDEVIDPAQLNDECHDAYDDNASETSDTSSDSSLQPYDMSDDDTDLKKKVSQLVDLVMALRKSDEPDGVEEALNVSEKLIRASPDELKHIAADLARTLVQMRCSELTVEGEEESADEKRHKALVSLLVTCPFESVEMVIELLYSPNVDVSQRILIIDVMADAALELAHSKTLRMKHPQKSLISSFSDAQAWFLPDSKGPEGSSPWREVSEQGLSLRWSHSYERTLPSKPGQVRLGKTRRWGLGPAYTQDGNPEWSKNRFPLYAAAFMLPAMQGFDKRRHGVDFLGRDFIVLGKLIHMLGVCMKCVALHPEGSALAPALLDMLSSRNVCSHAEAYVRRSVLFASSCLLAALHPSFIASALTEGNQGISKGLEWIRTWALHIAESDPDSECSSMAVACLQLHSEMALQASRALESGQSFNGKSGILPATSRKEIILPTARSVGY